MIAVPPGIREGVAADGQPKGAMQSAEGQAEADVRDAEQRQAGHAASNALPADATPATGAAPLAHRSGMQRWQDEPSVIPSQAGTECRPSGAELDGNAAGHDAAGHDAAGPADSAPIRTAPTRPGLARSLWLPLRLAWRQLRAERARLATAIAGVMFACVLVFMQLGFRSALFDSATALLAAMRGDVFLMQPMTTASFRPEPLPRARAHQALALPEVRAAVPVYLAFATWRNPEDGARRTIQLIGLDTEAGVMQFPGLDAALIDALKRPDAVAFDRRSRPEFGDVAKLLAAAGGVLPVEVGQRTVDVVGLVEIGPSFGADGNIVLSDTNFRRIVKERKVSAIDLVAIKLQPGTDLDAAKARLAAALPPDVRVFSQAELVAYERNYWETATPIGFIFSFGSVMGLIVGMVIVYQILFSDVAGHLREYATLKAIGYGNNHLRGVVLGEALILAALGFLPGLGASVLLYDVIGTNTFLPLFMTWDRRIGVFVMIFLMCAFAGLLAMRKLRDADPADMF